VGWRGIVRGIISAGRVIIGSLAHTDVVKKIRRGEGARGGNFHNYLYARCLDIYNSSRKPFLTFSAAPFFVN
jgi:hypothetical protein